MCLQVCYLRVIDMLSLHMHTAVASYVLEPVVPYHMHSPNMQNLTFRRHRKLSDSSH
jgi:hypothetical protein